MTRVTALYRSWGIPCSGKQVYTLRHRSTWLEKIKEAGVRRRAEFYYQQLDALRTLRGEVRRELLAESGKHKATKLLRQIPSIGPLRAALLIALLQTHTGFAPSDSCGLTVASASRPMTVQNTVTLPDNCNIPRSRNSCVGSIETTITISRISSRVRPPMRQSSLDLCKSFTLLGWPEG